MGERAELRWGFVALGLALGAAAGTALSAAGHPPVLCRTAGVAVLMAAWWITEAIPIYATGLVPAAVFPLLGILPMADLAPLYMKDVLFLFIGGFILAYAVERHGLHRRVALAILDRVGQTPARLLAGFMLAAWGLSMWILNTATATLLLPAALAVIAQVGERDPARARALTVPLLLGLAYASSIGGTATLIGTMPNLVLKDVHHQHFPDEPELDFARWFAFALPFSAAFAAFAWWWLGRGFRRAPAGPVAADAGAWIRASREALGPMGRGERVLAATFGVTVLAWFTMRDLDLGAFTLPGWADALGLADHVREGTVAMAAALALFLWPDARGPSGERPGAGIVRWADVQRVPIGVLFLFGGGFALAAGIGASGLGAWLSGRLAGLGGLPPWALVLGLALFTTFFTELTSNTASTILLLSLLVGMIPDLGLPPLLVLLPVTLSASCAFMLPVATPPNTIVFGSERLRVADMARAGLVLNLAGAVLLTLTTLWWGPRVFGW